MAKSTKKAVEEIIITGYKVTNKDMKCINFQFELLKQFKHEGEVKPCKSGFHFCEILSDCFDYYPFNSENRVFLIETRGKIVKEGNKSCTGDILFTRELTWLEVLTLVNVGKDNTGRSNSGYRNSGDRNSGNWNSGDSNSGDSNSGYRNSGDSNSGNWNSGDRNSGYRNSGDRNSGDRNSGYRNSGNWNSGDTNSGYRNSGDSNSGNWNSGDRNSGDSNSGNWNSGDRNSGNWNSGDRNSGNWNSGDRNSGDSNSGYRNSGAFCTDGDPELILFNKPSGIKVKVWEEMEVCRLMHNIDTTLWIPLSIMTDQEKKDNPKYEAPEGYLKTIPIKDAWINMWHNLTADKKKLFTDLPNFDAKIFEEITSIKL